MAIYGDNDVYANSPVAAYSVGTRDGGIISGGTGGNATVTQGVRFFWTYDPTSPNGTPSGFTGKGWFAETEGSPIWYSSEFGSISLQDILEGFKNGTRTTLDDVFTKWQNYVNAEGFQGTDVVQQFQRLVDYDCWSNINS